MKFYLKREREREFVQEYINFTPKNHKVGGMISYA